MGRNPNYSSALLKANKIVFHRCHRTHASAENFKALRCIPPTLPTHTSPVPLSSPYMAKAHPPTPHAIRRLPDAVWRPPTWNVPPTPPAPLVTSPVHSVGGDVNPCSVLATQPSSRGGVRCCALGRGGWWQRGALGAQRSESLSASRPCGCLGRGWG